VSSSERIPLLKDVPTFQEIGYPELTGSIWFWVAGPKALPAPIAQKLNAELRRFISEPETKQLFEKNAWLSMDADSAGLTKYISDEVKRWTAFVEEKGLKK
jgi:tripartite-type tricarboxylate transporter receptor subunit TctC